MSFADVELPFTSLPKDFRRVSLEAGAFTVTSVIVSSSLVSAFTDEVRLRFDGRTVIKSVKGMTILDEDRVKIEFQHGGQCDE